MYDVCKDVPGDRRYYIHKYIKMYVYIYLRKVKNLQSKTDNEILPLLYCLYLKFYSHIYSRLCLSFFIPIGYQNFLNFYHLPQVFEFVYLQVVVGIPLYLYLPYQPTSFHMCETCDDKDDISCEVFNGNGLILKCNFSKKKKKTP